MTSEPFFVRELVAYKADLDRHSSPRKKDHLELVTFLCLIQSWLKLCVQSVEREAISFIPCPDINYKQMPAGANITADSTLVLHTVPYMIP